MTSATGPSEVTKGNKIFAETALNCNFEKSSHPPVEPLFIRFSECFDLSKGWGDRRDSNPQQPEPQSGALPLSYGHRNRQGSQNLNSIFPGSLSTGMFTAGARFVAPGLRLHVLENQRRPSLGSSGSKEGRTSAGEINAANGMCSPANRRSLLQGKPVRARGRYPVHQSRRQGKGFRSSLRMRQAILPRRSRRLDSRKPAMRGR
jgi:hypothetical protein